MQHGFSGFGAKLEILADVVTGHNVLHLGAVGETCQSVATKLAAAPDSVHARLTQSAKECVGIDVDADGVEALTRSGIFDNLIVADATRIRRDEIPLPSIDFIVAGDIIEHLSSPGSLLDAASRLSDPGTRLVITTPNALGLPNFVRYLRGRVLEGPDHKVSFNVYTLRNLLEHHGWVADRVTSCHQGKAEKMHSRVAVRFGSSIFSRFPSLGGTLLLVARLNADT